MTLRACECKKCQSGMIRKASLKRIQELLRLLNIKDIHGARCIVCSFDLHDAKSLKKHNDELINKILKLPKPERYESADWEHLDIFRRQLECMPHEYTRQESST